MKVMVKGTKKKKKKIGEKEDLYRYTHRYFYTYRQRIQIPVKSRRTTKKHCCQVQNDKLVIASSMSDTDVR